MKIWKLIKDLYIRFMNDDILSIGAQVTFYLTLSIFPFLIFLISLITYMPFLNLQNNIGVLASFMPENAYEILRNVIIQTIHNKSTTLLSFGMLFTLWSSANGVTSLIRGINRAYDQDETRPFWKIILVSLLFTLELAVVIILSLILIVFGKLIETQIFHLFGLSDTYSIIWNDTRFIISFLITIFVLISLYHNTPNRSLTFKEVIPGAITASVGWVIISVAFSYYVNNLGNYPNLYGSLGGIIALFTWIYLSSIIIFMGAEINASLMFLKTGIKKTKLRRF